MHFYTRLAALTLSVLWLVSATANSGPGENNYETALSAYRNDDTQTAVILLKNILQEQPDNLSAHVLLGKAYLKSGDAAGAEKELRIANRLGADPSLTTVALTQALRLQGQYAEALELADPAQFPAPVQSELLVAHGHIQLETRQPQAARETFERAARLQPDGLEPLLGQALADLQLGQLQQAREVIARALELDSGSAQAWQVRASIEYADGDLSTALEYFERALEHEPDHLAARMGRIGVYMDLERYEAAVEELENLRGHYPHDPRAAYMLAVAHSRLGNEAGAEQALADAERVLSQIPRNQLVSDSASLLLSGLVQFSLGAWEKAYRDLSETVEQYPGQDSARKLLARIQLRRGDFSDVIRILRPLAGGDGGDYQTLTMLGTASMRMGRYNEAANYLTRALALDSQADEARMQHALVDLATGHSEQALAELEELLHSESQAEGAGTTLIVLHLQRRDPDAAIRVAEQLLKRTPDDPGLRNLLGAAQMGAGRFKQARASFSAVLDSEPAYLPARINLGKLARLQGDYPEARQILQHILEQQSGHVQTLIEMARVERASSDQEAAIGWLRKALAHDPASVTAVVELVDLLLSLEQPAQAAEVAKAAAREVEDNLVVLQALARSYLAQGEIRLARVRLDHMSKLAGYDSDWMFRIAQLQLQAGDRDAAMFSLQKTLSGRPDFLRARIMLAELYLQDERFSLAMEQARVLQENSPASSAGYRLAGDIHHGQGDADAAMAAYREALEREADPRVVVAQYRVLAARGEMEQGLALLDQWLKLHPQASLVRFARADALLRLDRHAAAARDYEMLAGTGFNPALVLNNLANVYLRLGDDRALATARRAHELDPDSVMLNDTLGWILVRQGRPDEALPYLRHAHAQAAGNPEIRYHIGVALQQQGRTGEARREFRAALDSRQAFDGRADARARLEALQSDPGA